jgi:hypothetical protein
VDMADITEGATFEGRLTLLAFFGPHDLKMSVFKVPRLLTTPVGLPFRDGMRAGGSMVVGIMLEEQMQRTFPGEHYELP